MLEPSRRDETLAQTLSFLWSLSSAPWNRFSALWLLSRGYSATAVGASKSATLLAKVLAQPVWAAMSDVHGCAPVLLCSTLSTALALEATRRTVESTAPAWRPLCVARIARSAAAASSPVHDALVLALLDGRAAYGRSRVWASLAWGGSSLALGGLVDWLGFAALFASAYALLALYAAGALLVLRVAPRLSLIHI